MPSRIDHAVIGGAVGLLCYLGYSGSVNSKPSILGSIASCLLGGIAGLSPDLLEPAYQPNHRASFHSMIAGGLLAYSLEKAARSDKVTPEKKLPLAILGLGYLSHLVLDARTNKSLPII